MAKTNCWEHQTCGCEPGGPKTPKLGVCPAATDTMHDGKNSGEAAGRYCWKIVGTLCGGEVQGSLGDKMMNCARCAFFNLVKQEEGPAFQA